MSMNHPLRLRKTAPGGIGMLLKCCSTTTQEGLEHAQQTQGLPGCLPIVPPVLSIRPKPKHLRSAHIPSYLHRGKVLVIFGGSASKRTLLQHVTSWERLGGSRMAPCPMGVHVDGHVRHQVLLLQQMMPSNFWDIHQSPAWPDYPAS